MQNVNVVTTDQCIDVNSEEATHLLKDMFGKDFENKFPRLYSMSNNAMRPEAVYMECRAVYNVKTKTINWSSTSSINEKASALIQFTGLYCGDKLLFEMRQTKYGGQYTIISSNELNLKDKQYGSLIGEEGQVASLTIKSGFAWAAGNSLNASFVKSSITYNSTISKVDLVAPKHDPKNRNYAGISILYNRYFKGADYIIPNGYNNPYIPVDLYVHMDKYETELNKDDWNVDLLYQSYFCRQNMAISDYVSDRQNPMHISFKAIINDSSGLPGSYPFYVKIQSKNENYNIYIYSTDKPSPYSAGGEVEILPLNFIFGCLAKDTIVTEQEYGEIPISLLQVGNRILADKGSYVTVTDIITGNDEFIYNLEADNKKLVRLTKGHPVLTDNGWKAVEEVCATDKVYFADGSLGNVTGMFKKEYQDVVYSVRVDGASECLSANGFIVGDILKQNDMKLEHDMDALDYMPDKETLGELKEFLHLKTANPLS